MQGQDVVVLLKVQAHPEMVRVRDLADALGYDVAGTHRALARLRAAGLTARTTRGLPLGAIEEFLVHAVKYVFPAVRSGPTIGVPASWAVEPLSDAIEITGPLPVWPDAAGTTRGDAFEPLHAVARTAAINDPAMRRRLALVDALRDRPSGQLRSLAVKLLRNELRQST